MFIRVIFSIVFLFSLSFIQAQNLIYSYTFDSNVEMWKSDSLSNSGNWDWSPNGKADQGLYWDNRSPIDGTQNGALVYDGDHIINSNQGDSTTYYETAIESPALDFSANNEVFIKFNQYYRNYDSSTRLEVSTDLGVTWSIVNLNTGINQNVETSANDYEILDISSLAANESSVQVRFVINGRYYFWILDDIMFYDAYPVIPTTPSYVGQYLTAHGYKYEVDSYGWPYVTNEAVVDFAPGTTAAEKEALRLAVGAVISETCVCNKLENWVFDESLLEGGIGLSSNGTTTGSAEQVMTSTASSDIDDIDFNKYITSEMIVGGFAQPSISMIINNHTQSENVDIIKVGIIDTGLDILHEGLVDNISLSSEAIDGIDNDGNCYIDNVVGWNFVDDNNNASDDQGHGSHVAGIVSQTLYDQGSTVQTVIIPYKTHDFRGVANLFDVTCAMYLAVKDQVSVVNCSWGFFGAESGVLKGAIQEALENNITVVAASGNDSVNLDDMHQFPACSDISNVISVGSYSFDTELEIIENSPFSNYSSKFVDVLANGVDITSTVPYNEYDQKTGTSMAAPVIAAHAILRYAEGYYDPNEIKSSILEQAENYDHLTSYVLDGNVLLSPAYGELLEESGSSSGVFGSSDYEEYRQPAIDVTSILDGTRLLLEFNSQHVKVELSFMSSQGQQILNRVFNSISIGDKKEIELGELPFGIYYLKLNEKVIKIVSNE